MRQSLDDDHFPGDIQAKEMPLPESEMSLYFVVEPVLRMFSSLESMVEDEDKGSSSQAEALRAISDYSLVAFFTSQLKKLSPEILEQLAGKISPEFAEMARILGVDMPVLTDPYQDIDLNMKNVRSTFHTVLPKLIDGGELNGYSEKSKYIVYIMTVAMRYKWGEVKNFVRLLNDEDSLKYICLFYLANDLDGIPGDFVLKNTVKVTDQDKQALANINMLNRIISFIGQLLGLADGSMQGVSYDKLVYVLYSGDDSRPSFQAFWERFTKLKQISEADLHESFFSLIMELVSDEQEINPASLKRIIDREKFWK